MSVTFSDLAYAARKRKLMAHIAEFWAAEFGPLEALESPALRERTAATRQALIQALGESLDDHHEAIEAQKRKYHREDN